ncbi:3-epi-6-deoxocathasterone 23-monooxygenase CYP90D1 [Camellia lanceoleosa]|uniref:3-epi-6-deoxocathasterone 23-monooxygenase CYP90D1 n=1 Tax=Camellia lanceoleosa TaxID=1840588 RepID=A0ACC0HX75_9ERIC|nr:3-epi-6-deoxocathasterone 23-monooxygenase CYP90D1 [Camellia lanceoleosa]
MDPGVDTEFLKKQFQEFTASLISLPINIPGSRLHRSLQAKKKMVELVHKIIEAKRKNRGRSEVAKDVADVLLNDASEELNDDLISDNMIDLMIPGEDSVPEENLKLKRLKDELREPLCWTDYLSLPFTQTVITETLRMGNVIVGVTTRKTGYCYIYSGEASEEFDRDDNTLTLIKPSPMPSKAIRSPLEVGSVHDGNNRVLNVDLEEDKTE